MCHSTTYEFEAYDVHVEVITSIRLCCIQLPTSTLTCVLSRGLLFGGAASVTQSWRWKRAFAMPCDRKRRTQFLTCRRGRNGCDTGRVCASARFAPAPSSPRGASLQAEAAHRSRLASAAMRAWVQNLSVAPLAQRMWACGAGWASARRCKVCSTRERKIQRWGANPRYQNWCHIAAPVWGPRGLTRRTPKM